MQIEWQKIPMGFILTFVPSLLVILLILLRQLHRPNAPASATTKKDSVLAKLPGHDCGLCGFNSCHELAGALVNKKAYSQMCTFLNVTQQHELNQIVGAKSTASLKCSVSCNRDCKFFTELYKYDGRKDCSAAYNLFRGQKLCSFSCLGLGSCIKDCPVAALSLSEGIIAVDTSACIGCGACVPSCPTGVLSLVPPGHASFQHTHCSHLKDVVRAN